MSTLIWLACVFVSWPSSSGPVAGYHAEVGGIRVDDVTTESAVACITSKYTPTTFRVQAFNAEGNYGPWSDPLTLERVHDFDADGSGTVGHPDFSYFTRSFGCRYLASGVAESCP